MESWKYDLLYQTFASGFNTAHICLVSQKKLFVKMLLWGKDNGVSCGEIA